MKNKLILGDCLEKLKELPDNSVDSIVSDPPYGYSFMSKDWDKVVVGVDTWQECLRVLKSGAFAFIMSAPRQDVLGKMIENLSKAGFQIGFSSIYWTYASGFPKASNISLIIDKQKCKKQLTKKLGRKPNKEEFEKAWKVFRVVTGKNQNHRTLRTTNSMMGEPHSGDGSLTMPVAPQAKTLDGSYGGFQPKPAVEIVLVAMKPLSEKTYVDQAMANGKGITWLDKGRILYESEGDKENSNRNYGTGTYGFSKNKQDIKQERFSKQGRFPANLLCEDDVLGEIQTKSGFRPNSKRGDSPWVGKREGAESGYNDSGSFSRYFSLDAWWNERVKKLPQSVQKTFPFMIVPKASKSEGDKIEVENNAKGGYERQKTWGLNDKKRPMHGGWKPLKESAHQMREAGELNGASSYSSSQGRFPANLLCEDDVLNDGENWKGKQTFNKKTDFTFMGEQEGQKYSSQAGLGEQGSFSRYFSLDAWWNERVKKLPQSVQKTFPFMIVPKASKSEKNRGLENMPEKKMTYESTTRTNKETADKFGCERKSKMQNSHPTTKPLKLMSYLITLGSRKGDVVLDPFLGSGTTAIAAKMLNRKYIGIEKDPEYIKIARARIAAWHREQTLFD